MRDPLDFVELLEILRVGHRDAERVADLEQRDRVEPLGHPPRQQPHGDRIDHAVAQPRGRHAQMALDERQDRVFLDHAHFDQHFAQPQALLRTFGQGLVQLLGRDEVGADQLLAERRPAARRGGRDGTAAAGLRSHRSLIDVHSTKLRTALPVSPKHFEPGADARHLQHFAAQAPPGFASFNAPPIR